VYLKLLNIVFYYSKKIFFIFSCIIAILYLFYFISLFLIASIYIYYFTKAYIAILKFCCCKFCRRSNYFISNNYLNCKKNSKIIFFKNYAFKSAISKQLYYIYNIALIVVITLNNNYNKAI